MKDVRVVALFPPVCPVWSYFKVSRHHFGAFFYICGGKLKSPFSKSHLRTEHIFNLKNRLIFARIVRHTNEKRYTTASLIKSGFTLCQGEKHSKFILKHLKENSKMVSMLYHKSEVVVIPVE